MLNETSAKDTKMTLSSFKRRAKGAALVEYGILVGLVSISALMAVLNLGGEVKATFTNVDEELTLVVDTIGPISGSPVSGLPVSTDPCGTLSLGSVCGEDDTTYVGDGGSGRMYMDFVLYDYMLFKTGSGNTLPSLSTSTGLQNTTLLLEDGASRSLSYPAAETCANMGEGWFLPSISEYGVIYDYFTARGIDYRTIFDETARYASSSTNDSGSFYHSFEFSSPSGSGLRSMTSMSAVACARTYIEPA